MTSSSGCPSYSVSGLAKRFTWLGSSFSLCQEGKERCQGRNQGRGEGSVGRGPGHDLAAHLVWVRKAKKRGQGRIQGREEDSAGCDPGHDLVIQHDLFQAGEGKTRLKLGQANNEFGLSLGSFSSLPFRAL